MLNIHPILVHFPIAFLTVYALLECVPFKRITQLPYWFYLKAALVIIGTLGSIAAFLNGNILKSLFRSDSHLSALVDRHSQFALATVLLFCLISAIYALEWCGREHLSARMHGKMKSIFEWKVRIAHQLYASPLRVILAIVGLALVTITGGLGGTIVYGPDIDPVAGFVYRMFGPK